MLDQLRDEWIESKGSPETEKALQDYMATSEYRRMPYHERNKGFITSSKLKDYDHIPLFAMWRHIEGQTTEWDDKDCWDVGQGVDDFMTMGENYFKDNYMQVKMRNSKGAVALKEDGFTLLTGTMAKDIQGCVREGHLHPLFPTEPKKYHVVHLLFGKYPCKAELDHFDEEDQFFVDYKTTANLLTFDKYLNEGNLDIQGTLYYLLLKEIFDKKYGERLCVMDKYKWNRSHVWEIPSAYFEERIHKVISLIEKWIESEESGYWPAPDISTFEGIRKLWASPFYPEYEHSRAASPSVL